ncbi:hypothetical protein GBF48_23405 [Salmonella enterica subsp. enterica]|nr:hypothetical protein [Salmonella enterica subsp. enterica serovar Pensacola]
MRKKVRTGYIDLLRFLRTLMLRNIKVFEAEYQGLRSFPRGTQVRKTGTQVRKNGRNRMRTAYHLRALPGRGWHTKVVSFIAQYDAEKC